MAKVSATQQLFAKYGAAYMAANPTAKSMSVKALLAFAGIQSPNTTPVGWAIDRALTVLPVPTQPKEVDGEMAYYMGMEMEAESRAIEYEEWEARGGR